MYDALVSRFDEASVFMDVDNIQPGEDFVAVLKDTLASCRAIIVVIDPQWTSATDQNGNRRLDVANDFVRIEIETAIDYGIRVFPALVDGAQMPSSDDLPTSITALANRNAVEISASRFRYDAGRLIDAIEGAIQRNEPRRPATSRVPKNLSSPESTATPGSTAPDYVLKAKGGVKFHGFCHEGSTLFSVARKSNITKWSLLTGEH